MNQRLLKTPPSSSVAYAYHVLRRSLEKFSKSVVDLSDDEKTQVFRSADRTYLLESRVLGSVEAQGVVIRNEDVQAAITQLVERYPDRQTFLDDLNHNGVSEDALNIALRRELTFDAVMNKVAANHAAISDLDVQLFYQMHTDRFSVPETRHARHLLITINDDFEGNRVHRAQQRILELRKQLLADPERFSELALQFSECPTALQGGDLGGVVPGTLYPELDQALFEMKPGQISRVLRSELGFHILVCDSIEPARRVAFKEVEHKIRLALEERRRRNCQKAWLKQLGDSVDEQ